MKTAVAYRGFVILPASRLLADVGMWGMNLHISWSAKDGPVTRHFFTDDQYATEEEATAHCITYGRQIIDGKISGLSVG